MHLFHNDYNEMCHPEIFRYLQEISAKQGIGIEDLLDKVLLELIKE